MNQIEQCLGLAQWVGIFIYNKQLAKMTIN